MSCIRKGRLVARASSLVALNDRLQWVPKAGEWRKMMSMAEHIKSRSGFTLVELLVVIAIIGILISLAFPAIRKAMDSGKRAQASTEVKSIESAVLSYFNEYGRFPYGNAPGGSDTFYGPSQEANAELINVLRANPVGDNENHATNPRRINFLEVQAQRLSDFDPKNPNQDVSTLSGDYKDPWEEPYFIYLDTSYDNDITGGAHHTDIRNRRVAVWSVGKIRPTSGDYSQTNRHIKSW